MLLILGINLAVNRVGESASSIERQREEQKQREAGREHTEGMEQLHGRSCAWHVHEQAQSSISSTHVVPCRDEQREHRKRVAAKFPRAAGAAALADLHAQADRQLQRAHWGWGRGTGRE